MYRCLLHYLTGNSDLQKWKGGRENPIGEFLGVTGPRNGAADPATATCIHQDSGGVSSGGDSRDDGDPGRRCEEGL